MTGSEILIPGRGKASAMRLLAIGAHPDDIEAGCGGTLNEAGGFANDSSVKFSVVSYQSEGSCMSIRKSRMSPLF